MKPPSRIELDRPRELLEWLATAPSEVDLDAVDVAQAWGLVGLAARARRDLPAALPVQLAGKGRAARFAHALGFEAVVDDVRFEGTVETGRTVPLRRFRFFHELEPAADETSRLIVADTAMEETRLTIYYVLVELLRNVVQHSGDKLGGVMAAQLMLAGKGGYARDTIQVAVADTGMGIPTSLSGQYPEAVDPQVGLERALWPHVSGAFPHGSSGSSENAGLGLFFIAEMAKRTAGRLVIASRGAALVLVGDPEAGPASEHLLDVGYPGTLVAFELALGEVADHASLIAKIQELARARTPAWADRHWLRFEGRPEGVATFEVRTVAEDTVAALRFAQDVLEPLLLERRGVTLDFAGLRICTQSFVHALLHDALRLAWARGSEIYVVNAAPAVRSTLALLESYALAG